MGNTTASLTHEQLFGGGVTIDGAAEIQSELRDRRDKKPSSELNFAPSKAGRVACFDEKRCYITDGELKPLAYFDADAYIAACGISDDGSVALFMTAYGPSGESTMLIDANTFSTIAAGAVQVSANTVRGINVDSARKNSPCSPRRSGRQGGARSSALHSPLSRQPRQTSRRRFQTTAA